jgi:4-hydroxy-tetrahydrodipicolinate reductase
MGSEVCRMLAGQEDMELAGGVEAVGHPLVGTPLGTGMLAGDIAGVIDKVDAVADFSVAEAVVEHARACARHGKALVTGVTGLTEAQTAVLTQCAHRIPLVNAPNFSVGIAALRKLATEAAVLLGADYDVEVIEVHHRRKADAPSGTAKLLVKAVSEGRKCTAVKYGRQGAVGAKPDGEVGVSSVRTGDVVGEHTVVFGGPGERIELCHKAESRAAFAAGVISAIRFAHGLEPGLYSLADVLGLD